MPVLNAQPVTDSYPTQQPGAILTQVFNSRGGWLSVSGAAVFCETEYGPQGSSVWTEEVELGDGAFVALDRTCTGVRFRNAVSGQNATVTVQIAQGPEPPLSVVALGTISVTGLSLTFQHNDVAQGSEPILDLEDSSTVTFALVDDPPNTRMKLSATAVGPVSSVFGRTGAVIAVTGDYTAAQVTNAADLSAAATQTFNGSLAINANPGAGPWAATAVTVSTAGLVSSYVTAASSVAYRTILANSADTFARFNILGDGTLEWGSGSGAPDTFLDRSSNGVLQLSNASTGGKLLEGWTETVQAGGNWQPGISLGRVQQLRTTSGAAITVLSPGAPAATSSTVLTLCIQNASGGAIASITWNAIFRGAPATIPGNGVVLQTHWFYDRTKAQWVLISSGTY